MDYHNASFNFDMLDSPDQDSIAKLARKVSMNSDKSAYTGPFLSRN